MRHLSNFSSVSLSRLLVVAGRRGVRGAQLLALGALLASPSGAAAGSPPFVETVSLIAQHEGENANDNFGFVNRFIGDVDNDGTNDYAVGVPNYSVGGTNRGKVYVFSGATGDTIRTHTKGAGAFFGYEVAGVGDVNGDGHADYAACAPRTRTFTGISGAARAFLFSGIDGAQLHVWRAEDYGIQPFEGWAAQVAGVGNVFQDGVGDLNNDGTPDILLSCLLKAVNGPLVGRVYAFSGADFDSVLFTVDGDTGVGLFGFGMGGVGDLDNDGHADFVVGASSAGADGRGRAYVYRGVDGTQFPWSPLVPDSTGLNFGALFAKGPGDVDGDGTPDVYVSDLGDSENGASAGKAYVFSGVDGSVIHRFLGEGPGAGFGVGRGCRDVDGDGQGDLFIAAFTDNGVANQAGKAYVISGATGTTLRTITNTVEGDQFGYSAVGIGDINGDGSPDFLISAINHDAAGENAGRVYVIAGEPAPTGVATLPAAALELRVFPNPTTHAARLSFSLRRESDVQVRLVDVTGRRVAEVWRGRLASGAHELGSERSLAGVAPGRYWFVVETNEGTAAQPVTVLR